MPQMYPSDALRGRVRTSLRDQYYAALCRIPLKQRRALLHARWHRRLPDFDAPRTFNEKIGWRILHDRRPELAWTCDKQRMKDRAARLAPDVGIPATLWFGTDLRELERLQLPERWILKPNHRSGSMVYRGSGQADVDELLGATRGWLGGRQWASLGEWAYDAARRAYLVETWIGDDTGGAPIDYKFYVFDGVPQLIEVMAQRFEGLCETFVTPDWERADVSFGLPAFALPPRPDLLDEMVDAVARIGAGFDFLRVDLYATQGRVWFGETTPYPSGGLERFTTREADLALGAKWTLPLVTT